MVERTVESLGDQAHCLFFTGEAARGETPLQKKIRIVPNLGYSTDTKIKPLDLLKRARGAFGAEPDVWHIHNHCLGKNPSLTQEILSLAMAGQKILLQIHDFAEDGRPDNYSNLGKLKKRLYPIAPHIHYAALNKRDYSFLMAAGIPEENLHLLPNPVSPLPAPEPDSQKPEPETPLYVYPCRAIRRKNIGELLLWSVVMPNAKFAITLAPQNPDVKPIYAAWVAFAKELNLQVEFDAGAKLPFHEMIAKADALITTSIAEGFGLAFLEPWLAGKPLVGRNLPEITGDFEAHGLNLSNLYNRLPVPAEWIDESVFFQKLETQMRAVHKAYGRPLNDSFLEEAKTALIQNGTLDFGILDEEMQRDLIRKIAGDPSARDRLKGQLIPASGEQVHSNQQVAIEAFSPKAYGDHLLSIYHELLNAKPGSVRYADGGKLLDSFLSPERFNLLRT